MALTPVRHVRVPDELWDAAKAKAGAEYRTVADVIVECLRNYVRGTPGLPVIPDPAASLTVASVEAHIAQIAEQVRSSSVGTGGNGQAEAVPTTAPRKRKPRAKITTAAELVKPPGERVEAEIPGAAYPCCKHCKRGHGGHNAPCLNGCHDEQA